MSAAKVDVSARIVIAAEHDRYAWLARSGAGANASGGGRSVFQRPAAVPLPELEFDSGSG